MSSWLPTTRVGPCIEPMGLSERFGAHTELTGCGSNIESMGYGPHVEPMGFTERARVDANIELTG